MGGPIQDHLLKRPDIRNIPIPIPAGPDQTMEQILDEAWKTTPAGRGAGAEGFDYMGLLQAVAPGMGGQPQPAMPTAPGGGTGQGMGPGMPGPRNPNMAQVPVSPVQVPQAGQMPGPMPPPPTPQFSVTPGGGAGGTAVVAGAPAPGPSPSGLGPVTFQQPDFISYEAAKRQQPDLTIKDYTMMRHKYEASQAMQPPPQTSQGGKGAVGGPVNRVGPMPALPPQGGPQSLLQGGPQGAAPQGGPQSLLQQQQQPQLPPYQPPQQHPLSIPSKLFGGPSAGQLNPAQQRVASRDAMINAGGAMLERGGPKPYGTPPATLMQQVSAGLRAGSQAYQGTAKGARMSNLAAQMQETMTGTGRELSRGQIDRWLINAMADAPELFQPLAQMRMAMADKLPKYSRIETADEDGNKQVEMVNDADPSDRHLMGPGYTTPKDPVYRSMTNDAGVEEYHVFDRDLYNKAKREGMSEAEAVGAATKGTGLYPFRRLTEMASRASFHLPIVLGSAHYFDPYLDKAPKWSQGRLVDAPAALGARQLLEGEMQRVTMASIAYADAWLRQVTGAAYKTEELQSAMKLFMPEFGDEPGTLQAKARNRALLETMLTTRAADRRMNPDEWQLIMKISHDEKIFSPAGEAMRRSLLGQGRPLTQDEVEGLNKNVGWVAEDLEHILGPDYNAGAAGSAIDEARRIIQEQMAADSAAAANR